MMSRYYNFQHFFNLYVNKKFLEEWFWYEKKVYEIYPACILKENFRIWMANFCKKLVDKVLINEKLGTSMVYSMKKYSDPRC